jgi:hypothetical protein
MNLEIGSDKLSLVKLCEDPFSKASSIALRVTSEKLVKVPALQYPSARSP